MDIQDEKELLRKLRKQRGDDTDDLGETKEHFLEENFEQPEKSDILLEKQTRQGRKRR